MWVPLARGVQHRLRRVCVPQFTCGVFCSFSAAEFRTCSHWGVVGKGCVTALLLPMPLPVGGPSTVSHATHGGLRSPAPDPPHQRAPLRVIAGQIACRCAQRGVPASAGLSDCVMGWANVVPGWWFQAFHVPRPRTAGGFFDNSFKAI